ncbi:MAG: putative 4-hydroxybenzoate polyprenyltransferase [Planctomycetales bacterium]
MWTRIRQILEMIRFSHTLFALPFALLAAVMAWSLNAQLDPPILWRWQEIAGVAWCMVMGRSAAMAFNRVADRKVDAENPRTSKRHLPAGELSVGSTAAFTAACCAGFVAGTLLFLPNWIPIAASVPVLAFLLGYSYAKRFTALAHFWLGAALMLAPLCAWAAIRGTIVLEQPADLLAPLTLGAAVMLWVAGFDVIYACQDADFDKQSGLFSVPATIGVAPALRLAAACHFGMVVLLFLLPWTYPLGWIYRLGIVAVAALLVWEHWLVRPDDLTRVNVAFFHVNSVISVGLFLIGVADLLFPF